MAGSQSHAATSNDPQEGNSMPKDAQTIAAILKETGVQNYEPRVINHLLEFSYRYITDILEDAKLYSNHAGNSVISKEDIKLAIQTKLNHSFTTPPPKDFLVDLARQKNTTTLPTLKNYTGARLPPDRYCLTSVNYRLKDQSSMHKKPYWQSASEAASFRNTAGKQSTVGVKRKWRDDEEY